MPLQGRVGAGAVYTALASSCLAVMAGGARGGGAVGSKKSLLLSLKSCGMLDDPLVFPHTKINQLFVEQTPREEEHRERFDAQHGSTKEGVKPRGCGVAKCSTAQPGIDQARR